MKFNHFYLIQFVKTIEFDWTKSYNCCDLDLEAGDSGSGEVRTGALTKTNIRVTRLPRRFIDWLIEFFFFTFRPSSFRFRNLK